MRCIDSNRDTTRHRKKKLIDWSVKRSSRCCYFLVYSRQRERETPFRLHTLNDRSRSRSRSIDDWSLARFSFFFLILFSWRFLNEYYRLYRCRGQDGVIYTCTYIFSNKNLASSAVCMASKSTGFFCRWQFPCIIHRGCLRKRMFEMRFKKRKTYDIEERGNEKVDVKVDRGWVEAERK